MGKNDVDMNNTKIKIQTLRTYYLKSKNTSTIILRSVGAGPVLSSG